MEEFTNKKEINARNINLEHRQSFNHLEKFAIWITKSVGTMGFFFIIAGWTAFWILWNILFPEEMKFDPFPSFVLWLFISNVLQLFFLPLIMVGQNLQGRHAELRAENDYEINLRSEIEVKEIKNELDACRKILEEIQKEVKK